MFNSVGANSFNFRQKIEDTNLCKKKSTSYEKKLEK